MLNSSSTEANRAGLLTAVLADAPKPDDHEAVRDFLHRLAELRCALLLIKPGTKQPFDGRPVRDRNAADKAAQQAAREAGQRNWQKVKSPAGVYLATDDPTVLDVHLAQYVKTFGDHAAVNVAVSVGRSGLVVVDCDTAGELAAFLADSEAGPDIPPTVRSPGVVDAATGEWTHSNGGHFYFTVSEGVDLTGAVESMSLGTGAEPYSVFWGPAKYVLTPPSVRAEGPYTVTGDAQPLPDWLLQSILAHGRVRNERAHCSLGKAYGGDKIQEWGATITWTEILAGTDWLATGKTDNCGCDIWAAPGPHASPKSATAHEPGCAQWVDSPDPPLHIWTDHGLEPFHRCVADGGTSTVTRLRAVAAIHYDDNLGAAMTALDLHGEPTTLSQGEIDTDEVQGTAASPTSRGLRITWASEIVPEPVPWLWVDIATRNTWSPDSPPGAATDPYSTADIACVAKGHEWSPPEVEHDGRIACGMVSIAAGREGSGKSSFGIWLTAKMTRGTLPGTHYGTPRRVFYLATEDSWKHTLVPRLIAAEADISMVGRIEVVVREGGTVTLSLPDDTDLLTQQIILHEVALVVVDPLMSTLGAGLDANGSRDVRTALEPLAAMADKTGAAVVGIAHFNKATGLDALSRITGSGAFKDVARAVMVFGDNGDEKVFTQPKNSVGRSDLPSLNYEIRQTVVKTPSGKTSTGLFVFTRVADRTVDDLLTDERSRRRRKSDVTAFVIDYITEHRDELTGEVDAADVIAAGEAKNYRRKQIIDARSRCTDPEISTRKEGFGQQARHLWRIER